MLKVGITGNIGSGKTTGCKVFEVLGIPVFYADEAAKKVMIEDDVLIDAIKAAFGNEAYYEDGSLNRKHIGGIVFNDKQRLEELNALVHPAVFRAFDVWVEEQADAPYVLKEAAILFESGSYKKCDRSILVAAPLDIRIDRVMKRDGVTADEVKSREARQYPQEKKMELADDIIINDDSELVIPQMLKLHELYLSLANNK
ncbi:dephospho-CoA kinase [Mucilaginibacter achroorhodeus]|uniref:Dephospho-CoA kinase n=1 Tax=Mucilaginibacter achroorhodeus TaxID=2599294 RepID=A0A563U782_9SPHI|nr:dephospho-CoA kinase [Mucilaginibacter achroorhodeus]TWR27221.1 dephospho-CoA kinase [Mucilaginibacter achroorhodeus]